MSRGCKNKMETEEYTIKSLRIRKDVYKKIKIYCAENEMTAQDFIVNVFQKFFDNLKKER